MIDRTGLILEIFGRRARTAEGALQVELAHLAYQKSRLVRSWTHLERQRGGFGFLGGPGETQIETDRRLIAERMVRIERELEKRQAHPRPAPGEPRRRSLSDRRAGRLHQRRQVDAVQPPDPGRRDGGRHAVRHPRSDHAADQAAARRLGDPVRHRRLHLRPADDADLGLPRHARRGAGRRRRSCTCATSLTPTARRRAKDVEAILAELGVADRADRVIEVWNKLDQLDADARAALDQDRGRCAPTAARRLGADRRGDRPAARGDRGRAWRAAAR